MSSKIINRIKILIENDSKTIKILENRNIDKYTYEQNSEIKTISMIIEIINNYEQNLMLHKLKNEINKLKK